MGQQQLLLLVLATVIVGLATVAGIQAFDENRAQAAQDALVQRGATIASDIRSLATKSQTLGGINLAASPGARTTARKLGYKVVSASSKNVSVAAPAAGSGSTCQIKVNSGQTKTPGTAEVICSATDAPQDVYVLLDPSSSEEIEVGFGSLP